MKTKRILSVALTLVMLIGLFPGMGLTASAAGSTTEITPSNTSGTLTITLKIKADQTAPAAPTAASVTINSITLNTITNGEYKIGDGEWQDSPAFTGLTMNTEYTFYQRIKGDEDHNASPASPAAVIKTSNHVHSFTYSASENTITATCTAGCTLPEGKISFSVIVPSGVTYDGNPHFASIEGGEAFSAATGIPVSADGIVYRYMVTDSVVSEPVDAGYYQVLYTLQSDFSRPFIGTGMTIAKATGAVSYAEASVSKTFGDDAFTNPLTNTGDGSVSYASDATGVATVDTSTGEVTIVGAGSATITATVEDGANYTYATKTASYTLTVDAAVMTVSAAGYDDAYDGNAHGITVTVTKPTSGYTVKYGTTEGTYDLDASPAITNAADSPLTVYYQVTANGYNPATGSATVTISKADPSYTVPTGLTATYGDTLASVTLPTGWAWADNSASVGNAGSNSFPATFTPTDTANYSSVSLNLTVTVGKATVSVTAEAKSKTYGESDPALTYTATGLIGSDTLSGALSREPGEDAGVYAITQGTLTAGNNYIVSFTGANLTVNKASITPSVSLDGWTYGEAAKTPSVTGNTDNGAVTYTYAVKGSTDFSVTVPTNAGDYTVKATVAATNNYNGGEATADFTIAKAEITVTADDKSSKYGEDIAELTYTVSGAYVTGDELGVTLSTAATKTSVVGEYPINVNWNENPNYAATLVNGKYTITKTGLAVTAADYSGVYDGAAHGITVDVGSSDAVVYYSETELTADNYSTSGSTTAVTYTDAGEYTVYFYVISGNYAPDTVSGSKTVTISKATGTAGDGQKPTANTLTFTGEAQALVTAPTALPDGYTKVQYSVDNGTTWTDAVPTGIDAGDFTVSVKYVGDLNHNDFNGNPVSVSVGKATGTAGDGQKPTAQTGLAENGKEQALVTAPASLPDGYTKVQYSMDGGTVWTDTVPTGKEAGDYTVSVKYVGDDNHADFEGDAITVKIKAVYTVKFNMNGADAMDDQSVVDGEKATKPADPNRDGYKFDGWYQDATFAKTFDFETPITANVTVYAKWTAIGYSITSITGTTADASHSWTKGSTTEVVITVKPDEGEDHSFAHFTGVQIDGKTLTRDTDYTAREGSTIVTLKPATLQKLSVGAHTVTIVFDNGSVETKLTIKAAPGSTTYTLTFNTNGGSSIASISRSSGTTIKLDQYEPTRDGYTFAGWYSDSALTNSITEVKLTKNTTIYAKWTKIVVNPFTDVKSTDYYYDAVLWAAENGVTSGTSATTFSPDMVCTRAQMVTFLWRTAGSPAATGTIPFTDIDTGAYYYNAVRWVYRNGVTVGTSATTFSPDMTVTRAQVETLLFRYKSSPAQSGSIPFTDVASGSWYYDAVRWAVRNEITNGTSATTFSPNDGCTRAQIVTFLYRADKK